MVPYVVIPTGFKWRPFSAEQGDVVLATHLENGAGISSGTYQYVVFRNSRLTHAERWPRSNESIRQQVIDLINDTPDIGKLSGLA